MENKRVPYRVNGGQALAVVREFIKHQVDTMDSWREFAARHKSKIFHFDVKLRGLAFDAEVPAGWVRGPACFPGDVYVPDRKTATGRKIATAMDDLPRKLTGDDLARRLGMFFGTTGVLEFPSFEKIGDVFVIHVPADDDGDHPLPPGDCARMKMSEYWVLRESVELLK